MSNGAGFGAALAIVLSLGDQETKPFGLNVRRDRALVIGTSSMLTALVVSISGIIGWVGIVVPHLARLAALGVENRSMSDSPVGAAW